MKDSEESLTNGMDHEEDKISDPKTTGELVHLVKDNYIFFLFLFLLRL